MKEEIMTMTDKNFIDWESHVFGFGYGTGEPYIIEAFKMFFKNLEDGRIYNYERLEKKLGGTSTWFLINTLGQSDLIDYGTSSRFGWLTEKGEALKEYFDTHNKDELYEILMSRTEDYILCSPDCHQCDTPCNNPLF